MIPLRLDEEAEQELRAAHDWYEEQLPGLGAEFVGALDHAFARIQRRPRAFALEPGSAPKLGIRRLVLASFPFTVYFVILKSELRVLAIAHQRRKPGYWKS